MVTHDNSLAQIADRIFHIKDGKLIKVEEKWKEQETEEKAEE